MLILSENFPPMVGGSARWAGKIAEHWPGPVQVLMARSGNLSDRESKGRVDCHRTRFSFPSWAPDNGQSIWSYLAYTSKAMRLAARHRPRWCLVGRGLPEGVAAMAVRLVLRVPYAVLAHGEEIATCMSSRILRKMLSRVYRKAGVVIANSENSRRLALQCGARRDNCIVSHPGTDVSRFSREVDVESLRKELGLAEGPVVLSVGRLERRKNHQAVVEAIARLVRDGMSVSYLIAGTGEEQETLKAQIKERKLESVVHLLGCVDEDRLVELYHLADVFALPGIETATQFEGFGIVFVEAAAAGVPSVCGRAGGSREAVLDGRTGLAVDGDDLDQVTDALDRLVRDDFFRKQMGARARERALAELDWQHLTGSLIEQLHQRRRR
ncbi:MAG: glycosyltransferase family 4 protein [Phycisphaerae bacterium]